MRPWILEPARDAGLPIGERIRSLRRESGLAETVVRRAWWAIVRAWLSVVHHLEVRGRERIPSQPPFVLVANHASHLDAVALASLVPGRLRDRTFPIAAGDTFFERLPTALFAAFFLNALPLWRKRFRPGDLETLRRRLLEDPCVFVLFPEGTRARDGRMATFRRGIGMLVAGTPVPVVPCRIAGTFEAWPPHRRWPRPGKITVTVGSPIAFPDASEDREGSTRVAAELEAAVRDLAP